MKMKYELGNLEVVTRLAGGDVEIKINDIKLEQEFSAEELIKIGVPALKEIATLLIETQRELAAQTNEISRKEVELQEKKFQEELRRNRRIFHQSKKDPQ